MTIHEALQRVDILVGDKRSKVALEHNAKVAPHWVKIHQISSKDLPGVNVTPMGIYFHIKIRRFTFKRSQMVSQKTLTSFVSLPGRLFLLTLNLFPGTLPLLKLLLIGTLLLLCLKSLLVGTLLLLSQLLTSLDLSLTI